MGEFLSTLKADFSKKALYDVLKYSVIGIGALVIGYVSFFTGFFKNLSQSFVLSSFLVGGLAGLVLCGLVFGSVKVYKAFQSPNTLKPDFPVIDANFEILDLKILYDHKEIDRMVYTKRKKVRALKDNLDRYVDRYNWTGKGTVAPQSLRRSEKYVETDRKSTWQYYELRFERALKKGEELDVDVVWNLEDLEKVAVPFISATIEEPTNSLSLKVKFPDGSNVDHVIKEISPFIGAKMPFSSVREDITEMEYEWIVRKPKLLFHYELRWDW
jgi:hypothetical protein